MIHIEIARYPGNPTSQANQSSGINALMDSLRALRAANEKRTANPIYEADLPFLPCNINFSTAIKSATT